jgi:acid phosphatase
VAPPDHVVVLVLENKDSGSVMGSEKAPTLNGLAARGLTFTDAHGETHPSQPNYLALFTGQILVHDNTCPSTFDVPNLAGQLLAAGRTFVGYAEDLPAAGYTGCHTGSYTRSVAPWVDFPALPTSVNQPFSAFPTDYERLPTVAFIAPNLCNDMHNCSVETGDRWARRVLEPYVRWAQTHNSLLIVTFDEDEGSAANHVPTFVVGSMVRGGTSDQRVDHYNILRTIEDLYGLPPLGHAAEAAHLSGV